MDTVTALFNSTTNVAKNTTPLVFIIQMVYNHMMSVLFSGFDPMAGIGRRTGTSQLSISMNSFMLINN